MSKRYGRVRVLEEASWRFTGKLTLLLAPNGAGKTTLLGISLGLYKPDSGDAGSCVSVGDIGFLVDVNGFPLSARVGSFIEFVASLRGVKCGYECVGDVLNRVWLPRSLADKRLAQLSSGQLRLVLIAQALVGSPSVIVLDEPFANLDPANRLKISILINKLSEKMYVVVASHLVSYLHADEAYTIVGGRVERIPVPSPRNARVMNLESGEVLEVSPSDALNLVDKGFVVLD
ncbi:MAG: ATP-binding cassette domain-containing protein [Crenarchaeota archaeon]|nr:ATP-binding cassette domain-containing protein [Thermoproteota archaeon]